MKKHLLSALGLIAACTMSATQYMHINLPDGKEYDVKVEKTDHVSHVTEGDEVFIKVTRTDGSFSLYPMNGAEVTFDEEIARMDDNVTNWNILKMAEGCVYDTTKVHELRESGAHQNEIEKELQKAQKEFDQCVSEKKSENETSFNQDEIEDLRSAYRYSTELFSKISNDEKHKDKNVVFSPTSLQFALAMLANGADDDGAYAEITTALGKKDMPLDQLNEMYAKRINNLTTLNPRKVTMGVANAAFLKINKNFGKNFLQNIERYYKAVVNNVDFEQDSTYTLMDNWAKASTDSMIKKIGVKKEAGLAFVLANALCFKSEWVETFSAKATAPGQFVTSKGEEKQVEKMNRVFDHGYAEGTNHQLVTLDLYEGFVMNIILPNEGASFDSVLTDIDLDSIHYKYDPDTTYCPSLSLPKFNTDDDIPLNDVLKQMGFKNTFIKYFNNIADTTYISSVNQLTHLEIDEDGAKGAAITTIVGKELTASKPKFNKEIKVDVNRPFIVTINNPSTHEVLFIGLINDPTLKK